jgi:2-C-methyl-D-erythritol 4-phosphate cytidylyltransferase
MSVPTLKAVLAITSPSALASMGHSHVLVASAKTLRDFARELGQVEPLLVAANGDLADAASELLTKAAIAHTMIVVDVNSPADLAAALAPEIGNANFVAVHDANRPLTRLSQFHRTLEALLGDLDAARGQTPFTETLKAIGDEQMIEYTIERSAIRRISTPEIVRREQIDIDGTSDAATLISGWFLPLLHSARCGYVDSDPESIRVNSEDELALLASFLHWQQTVAIKN